MNKTINIQPPKNHWLTSERVNVYSWIFLVIFTIFLGSFIYESFISTTAKDPRPDRDFITYYAAAELAEEGRVTDAYDLEKMHAAEKAVWPKSEKYAWFYPPTFYALIKPLAALDYKPAFALFMTITFLLYLLAAQRLVQYHATLLPVAAFPAVLVNLIYGQNAFLTAGLVMLAFANLYRRPAVAGMLIGLLVIKPQMAVLFPLLLICGRHWQAFFAAAVTATLVCLLSTWSIGIDAWPAFFNSLSEARQYLEAGKLRWSQMISVFSDVKQLGGSTELAYRLHIGWAAILLALCVFTWLQTRDLALRATTFVLATLHFSPYMYDYELVWMALPLILLGIRGSQTGWLRFERELLLIAWLFPFIDLTFSKVVAVNMFFLLSAALAITVILHLKRAKALMRAES
ncbi:MAG: glycosyltransferase family 87 protein [Pseudomonadota bacterium]